MTVRKLLVIGVAILGSTGALAEEKHPDDPTKIVTKAGFAYNEELKFSGSIGLDEARMINARVNADGEEWRVGDLGYCLWESSTLTLVALNTTTMLIRITTVSGHLFH